jgi:CelD/BcsL family acetyltransferase involved in cellulose biosynthesis
VITTRLVTSIGGVRALGPDYDAMVLAAGAAGLFYQLAWLERVWPYYHARLGGTLAFVMAERNGELVGLAPLILHRQGWSHARRRVLSFIGGTSDELDNWMPGFLFATSQADEQAAIMSAFVDAIAHQPWDLLDLRFVRDSAPGRDVLQARFPDLRATPDRLTTPRARVDDWPAYWASRSRRLTRMVERGRARAAEDGVTIAHEVTPGVAADRRSDAAAIHRSRQDQLRAAGRARSSPFDDRETDRVFWALIDWATSQGQLRAHWLRIADRTAAYVIALHHAGTTFAYFNAIDPAAERYHPGNLILAGLIERETTEYGATVIDMMAGANLTKSLFATEEVTHTRLSVVNPRQLRSWASDAWIRAARAMGQRLPRG